MKIRSVFLLVSIVSAIVVPSVAFSKSLVWEEFRLKKYHEKVEVSVKGIKSDYYAVTQDEPLEVKLRGPRKVLVHVRNSFVGEDRSMMEYHLNVLQDGRNFDEYAFRASPTRLATLLESLEDRRLGRLRKFILEVPEGVHRLKFFPAGSMNQQKLFLKFFISEILLKNEKRVSMSPDQYDEVVHLIYKEREYTYYRMTQDKPVELSVVGPTELKVITRLEFNRRMKGKFSYQIQIFEDGKLTQTRQYRTYKSDAASYTQVTNVTPGRSRSFLISVPHGKHVYRLVPITLQKETVIAKLLIPQKDVGIIKE